MLTKFNIKKGYYLFVGAIILLIIAYQLDFKKTLQAWHIHKSLEKQLQLMGNLSYQPGYLERKSRNLDKTLKKYQTDTLNVRSNTFSVISTLAEQQHAKLSEVPVSDSYLIAPGGHVVKLGFEGDYFSLIKTLSSLESKDGIGVIRSVQILKPSTDFNNESKLTQMTIFIQGANN